MSLITSTLIYSTSVTYTGNYKVMSVVLNEISTPVLKYHVCVEGYAFNKEETYDIFLNILTQVERIICVINIGF